MGSNAVKIPFAVVLNVLIGNLQLNLNSALKKQFSEEINYASN